MTVAVQITARHIADADTDAITVGTTAAALITEPQTTDAVQAAMEAEGRYSSANRRAKARRFFYQWLIRQHTIY